MKELFIEDLEERIWYRLSKVLFYFLLLILFIFSIIVGYFAYMETRNWFAVILWSIGVFITGVVLLACLGFAIQYIFAGQWVVRNKNKE